MRPFPFAFALAAALVAAPALAPAQQSAPAPTAKPAPAPGRAAAAVVTVKAKVVSIDLATRTVVLEGENGVRKTIVVGEQARNLPQVRPGDIVTTRYAEAVAIDFARRGSAPVGTSVSVSESRAKPGERPGGTRTETITTTAVIESIDVKKPGGVIRLPDGSLHEVKAQSKERLRNLKVGDEIDITFVRALAITVTPAPKS